MLFLIGVVAVAAGVLWLPPRPRPEPAPEWVQDASLGRLTQMFRSYR
jgi:hypothetical protein